MLSDGLTSAPHVFASDRMALQDQRRFLGPRREHPSKPGEALGRQTLLGGAVEVIGHLERSSSVREGPERDPRVILRVSLSGCRDRLGVITDVRRGIGAFGAALHAAVHEASTN